MYTNAEGKDVFYRIVEIPEEENITIYAENIAIGSEGGNYRLLNRFRINGFSADVPTFGLYSIDSLKFIDSVRVKGYFNNKKLKINLHELSELMPL